MKVRSDPTSQNSGLLKKEKNGVSGIPVSTRLPDIKMPGACRTGMGSHAYHHLGEESKALSFGLTTVEETSDVNGPSLATN